MSSQPTYLSSRRFDPVTTTFACAALPAVVWKYAGPKAGLLAVSSALTSRIISQYPSNEEAGIFSASVFALAVASTQSWDTGLLILASNLMMIN